MGSASRNLRSSFSSSSSKNLSLEPGAKRPSRCSPKAFHSTFVRKGRCVSDADILNVAQKWNARFPDRRIDESATTETILAKLHRVLGKDHASWQNHDAVRDDRSLQLRLASRFRPKKPPSWQKKPTMWLSTVDIERVMRQYRKLHPEFKFMGVHPRDFTALQGGTCISGDDICNPDFERLMDQGTRALGIVFNMDRHDQAGSHWVACFVSLDPAKPMFGAYYYDSVARPPPPEIATWLLKVLGEVAPVMRHRTERRFELAYNRKRRQFQNTECGMFAMFFLAVAMRNELTFQELCDAMGGDDDMHALRSVMYR